MANTTSQPAKILVAGATGYLGGHVVRALHEACYPVRALARDAARLGSVRDLCHEVFVGQATDPSTLHGLVGGASVVFSSLGKHDFKRRPTALEIDRDANLNIVRAAVESGVEHFVFISVLHGARLRDAGIQAAVAREAVVDALKASGMAWTILRPTGFFNDMKDIFEMAAEGAGWLPGDGSFRMNPIHGADLAAEVARCVGDPAARGQELDVGGPDVLTYREMLDLAFSALKRPPKMRRAPLWTFSAAASVVGLYNPFVGDLIRSIRLMADWGAVAPTCGTHHLADFYVELAGARG